MSEKLFSPLFLEPSDFERNITIIVNGMGINEKPTPSMLGRNIISGKAVSLAFPFSIVPISHPAAGREVLKNV